MRQGADSYRIRITDALRQKMGRPRFWRNKHPRLQKRYCLVLGLLAEDPYGAASSERLRHDYAGLRSARLLAQWRLIFKVCEECICLQMKERNPLDCCRGEIALPRKTINIVDMSNHYA